MHILPIDALLRPSAWDANHLESYRRLLWSTSSWRNNYSAYERRFGAGSYSRLCAAFANATIYLDRLGVIEVNDLTIIQAYFDQPRRTYTGHDDKMDFKGPRRRLAQALLLPDLGKRRLLEHGIDLEAESAKSAPLPAAA
ncbi:hypothetical protein [Sphingosinicella sp. BN140058]|uniref:hypothetical protein n=1 Tax=Sphingosinicella sp. BN140058 TaxID=1892855 RepID=UPI0010105F30|nr:hypothetical protein [Sphingosinicella sp. BN140058]QAY80331.1 hypothetical protein ETR14_27190 [Sphingosinicella sp. BN140058]